MGDIATQKENLGLDAGEHSAHDFYAGGLNVLNDFAGKYAMNIVVAQVGQRLMGKLGIEPVDSESSSE